MAEALNITVDGAQFWVQFSGWDRALRVNTPPGELRPWTLDLHLEQLASSAAQGPDAQGFADAVLAQCWSGAPDPALRPLALWWAAGGDSPPARTVTLGESELPLRPWRFAERAAALAEAGAFGQPPSLDLVKYLSAMVRACLPELPAQAFAQLPAGPTLAAVSAVNQVAPDMPPALRETTRRLCQFLGWTPRQVWQADAAEMDEVLQLIQAEPAPAPRAPAPQGLAAHPDTTVIWFED